MSKQQRESRVYPGDWVVVDCAGCGHLVRISPKEVTTKLSVKYPIRVSGGRIHGRAHCVKCLRIGPGGVSGVSGGLSGPYDDTSPSFDNAIRAMED